MLSIFICSVVLCQNNLDRQTLKALVAGQFQSVEDLSCEYEGTMSFPQATPDDTERLRLGEGGLYDTYSGVYSTRSDGAVSAHVYKRQTFSNEVSRQSITHLSGKFQDYTGPGAQKRGEGQIKPYYYRDFDREGSLGRIWLLPTLMGYLDDEKVDLQISGYESVEGRDCLKLSFTVFAIFRDGSRKTHQIDTFWIDLLRGSHALKREIRSESNDLTNRLASVKLAEFKNKAGKAVWVPIAGTFESFGQVDASNKLSYSQNATNLEKLWVVAGTTRINSRLPDERFLVNYKTGSIINDRIKGERFEAGQDRRPPPITREDAEGRLQLQLKQAEEQGKELKASSWERSRYSYVPWVIVSSSIALVAAYVVWLVRRSG